MVGFVERRNPLLPAMALVLALLGGMASAAVQSSPAAAAAANATFTYPRNGQTAVIATKPFTWSPVAGAQGFIVAVGTTRFGTDVAESAVLPALQTSYQVPALATGKPLYATLLTERNGVWGYHEVIFTPALGDSFTYPTDGMTNVDLAQAFSWSSIPASQGAILVIGTTKFGTDMADTGLLPPSQTSFLVPALPAGVTLYAALLTKTNGGYTRYQVISFTASPTTTPARVTLVNSYFAAVHLVVNGQSYDLAAGQQMGPVAITPAPSGNDTVELSVLANPGCGLGDASKYFYAGHSYRFTVITGSGTCADHTMAPDFTVTAA